MPTKKNQKPAKSAVNVKTNTKAKAAQKPVKAAQKPVGKKQTAKKPTACDCKKCKKDNVGKCHDTLPAKKATAKKEK